MVMQDPMTALDPSFTICEANWRSRCASTAACAVGRWRRRWSRRWSRCICRPIASGCGSIRISSAAACASASPARSRWPAQPGVLIADEPTTALDVTTQARYLQLLRELQEPTGFALLLIAHDLFVVRHMCERVVVMYAGQVVEEGPRRRGVRRSAASLHAGAARRDPGTRRNVDARVDRGPGTRRLRDHRGCRFAAAMRVRARDRAPRAAAPDRSTHGRARPMLGH